MVKEYQVNWKISGSVSRPQYKGKLKVWARDVDHAKTRVRTELKLSFVDVPVMQIQIESVTEIA